MSGKADSSSAINISTTDDRPDNAGINIRKSPSAKHKMNNLRRMRRSNDCRKMIGHINATYRKQIRTLKVKYKSEIKSLRASLQDQAKKSKHSIKKAAAESKTFYQRRLNQISLEYQGQNEALRKELHNYMENSFNEIAENYQTSLTGESDVRFDSLKRIIQTDFVDELQKKVDEIEQLKTQTQKEISEVIQESDLKGHRMSQLEGRLKDVSQFLPADVREELYEQFGFEEDMAEIEVPRSKRKSILGRLTSII